VTQRYQSWGRYPRMPQRAVPVRWRDAPLPELPACLPFGNGRSYGDSCLIDKGVLLDARGLDRFIAFDPATGVLRCEAGVLLAEILELSVPRGWFLPVTPGTRFVTLGGAIANDVHGKNHHGAGTFGRHVRCFELLRSDGQRLLCSPQQNVDWFAATIGGLGLTGLIGWAEIALKRIASPAIRMETIRFAGLDDFFALSAESDRDFEHTVAWVDCLAQHDALGRGLFMRGNHAPALGVASPAPSKRRLRVPFELPVSLVNQTSLRLFNGLYYRKQIKKRVQAVTHYEPFFYPLDGVEDWNRIYGPRGFLQYQCVVPHGDGRAAIREILARIATAGCGSFLAVLKIFGNVTSPGWLSFPRPGVTLALDFPNHGETTLRLLAQLDEVVAEAGGAVYPAKDARLSATHFQQFFPRWQELNDYRDPRFSSLFWRRVTTP